MSRTEIVFLKLGGSLITEKAQREVARVGVLGRVAAEIASSLQARPELRLVLGHGSGSFGHYSAEQYGVHRGCLEDWWGYAQTAAAASRLNRLVVEACLAVNVPAVALQPSASARARGGELVDLVTWPLGELLERGAVPVVYGDVALDEVQGCSIISTEAIFACIAQRITPRHILLAGEVDGVYTGDPQREPSAQPIKEISPATWGEAEQQLLGARGVDVTGGMRSKVRQMLDLIERVPGIDVSIFSGLLPGRVERALRGDPGGTLLRADADTGATG